MDCFRPIGLELRKVDNLIRRQIVHSRPAELDEFTCMHGWAMRYFFENRDRDIFQRDFEAFFSIRRSTATQILQRMEKNGLIVRESVDYDARLKKIRLTDKAVRLYQLLIQDIRQQEQRIRSGISEEELSVFYSVLDKIISNVEEYDD